MVVNIMCSLKFTSLYTEQILSKIKSEPIKKALPSLKSIEPSLKSIKYSMSSHLQIPVS